MFFCNPSVISGRHFRASFPVGGINTQETSRLADTLRPTNPAGLAWYYEPLPKEAHATMLHTKALKALGLFFPAQRQVSSGT